MAKQQLRGRWTNETIDVDYQVALSIKIQVNSNRLTEAAGSYKKKWLTLEKTTRILRTIKFLIKF